jgi:4-amino-4-deoxy-L-arabinose transferase-like glycosyltransferase
MSTSTPSPPAAAPARPVALPARARLRAIPVPRPELAGLLVLAAVLNLWSLDANGWANTYYSAAVRSMSTSWHDFLFASFDRAGVMTVDKPPLALWVQALSARAFGFSSWSILVPQALMGVATVALAYDLTRRRFGRAGGFAAGLVLATTPITVAISRHNNPDALLVLCVTAALWCAVRALEDGRTRWLVGAGIGIGLGFETKMGAALLVVPALAAAYAWVAPRGRLAALRQLGAGGAALAVTALAWPVLVWLTPAGSRPWISGTSDNSIWSLIFGYNGLGRLDGQQGGPGGAAGGGGGGFGGPGGGGGGANGLFGGATGPGRLLNDALGGQAGWLLGAAVVAGVALVAVTRLRRDDPRTGWLIAAGGTFATIAVAFSVAHGIFHPYYVSELAPFTAVLVGAGVAVALGGGAAARIAGPAMLAAGVATELVVLHDNPGQLGWAAPLIVAAGALGAIALAVGGDRRARGVVLGVALAALLAAPATWAAQTLGHATNGTFPAGGPATAQLGGGGGPAVTGGRGGFGGRRFRGQAPSGVPGGPGQSGALPGPPPAGAVAGGPPAGGQGGAGGPGGAGGSRSAGGPGSAGGAGGPGAGMFGGDANLAPALAYAKAHGGGTVAVSSQQGAASAVIASGAEVAGLGGFSGRESEVSARWLASAVAGGRVRWVLTDGQGGGMRDGRVGSSALMAAVQRSCRAVSLTNASTEITGGGTSSTSGFYDCRGRAAQLRAAGGAS